MRISSIFLTILLILTGCTAKEKPLARTSFLTPKLTAKGLLIVGVSSNSLKERSLSDSEANMYASLHRYLGGSFYVLTNQKAVETHERPPQTTTKSFLSAATRVHLPPSVGPKYSCVLADNLWTCTSTLVVPLDTLESLKKEQRASRAKRLQRKVDIEFVLDKEVKHSVKSKIDTLRRLYIRESVRRNLNVSELASEYLKQISIQKSVNVDVSGPGSALITLTADDSIGCLDGFTSQIILPSGKMVSGKVTSCRKMELRIPRPVDPGSYTLPLVLIYRGVMLGPSTVNLEAKGTKNRLAGGLFHPYVEALGTAQRPGKSKHDYIEWARGAALRSLNTKASKAGISQVQVVSEEVSVVDHGNYKTIQVKVMGAK